MCMCMCVYVYLARGEFGGSIVVVEAVTLELDVGDLCVCGFVCRWSCVQMDGCVD